MYANLRVETNPGADSIQYFLNNALIYTGVAGVFAGWSATEWGFIAAALVLSTLMMAGVVGRIGAGIVADRRWYLFAWDLDRDDWRTFRVDRMRPRIPTGPRFAPRELPDDVAAYVSSRVSAAACAWPRSTA